MKYYAQLLYSVCWAQLLLKSYPFYRYSFVVIYQWSPTTLKATNIEIGCFGLLKVGKDIGVDCMVVHRLLPFLEMLEMI